MNTLLISQERLLQAKIAYTPRNLKLETVAALLQGGRRHSRCRRYGAGEGHQDWPP